MYNGKKYTTNTKDDLKKKKPTTTTKPKATTPKPKATTPKKKKSLYDLPVPPSAQVDKVRTDDLYTGINRR